MALYIKDNSNRWREWHIGESLPPISGQVISFQADGDELDIILATLDRKYGFKKYVPVPGGCVSVPDGASVSEQMQAELEPLPKEIRQEMSDAPAGSYPGKYHVG